MEQNLFDALTGEEWLIIFFLKYCGDMAEWARKLKSEEEKWRLRRKKERKIGPYHKRQIFPALFAIRIRNKLADEPRNGLFISP